MFWLLMGVKRAGWSFWNGGRQSVPSAERRESAKRDAETAESDVQSAKGKKSLRIGRGNAETAKPDVQSAKGKSPCELAEEMLRRQSRMFNPPKGRVPAN
jgi:hypothetical protein